MATDLGRDSQRAALEDALQVAWNDWCLDTGCIPDGFSIHGPRTTRVEADFRRGNYVGHVIDWLNAKGFAITLREDTTPREIEAPSEIGRDARAENQP